MLLKPLLLLLLVVLATTAGAQTVRTLPIPASATCSTDSFDVSFEALGPFESNNIFRAQLSNASGSFDQFQTMGSIKGTSSGSIRIAFPYTINEGSKYRLRVISTSPYIVGEDNGSDLFIPKLAGYHMGSSRYVGLVGDTFNVSVQRDHKVLTNTYSYWWQLSDGAIPQVATGNPVSVVYQTPGDKLINVSTTLPGGCMMHQRISVWVADCFPMIPNNAQIIDADTSYGPNSKYVWVRSGGTYLARDSQIVYAESGATIGGTGYGGVIYLKPGAEYNGTSSHRRVFAYGASGGGIQCPSLEFDYSTAPTPDQYASVEADQPTIEIEHVGSMIEVWSDNKRISSIEVYDILGRLIFQRADISSFDTFGWTDGKYFLRVKVGSFLVSRALMIDQGVLRK